MLELGEEVLLFYLDSIADHVFPQAHWNNQLIVVNKYQHTIDLLPSVKGKIVERISIEEPSISLSNVYNIGILNNTLVLFSIKTLGLINLHNHKISTFSIRSGKPNSITGKDTSDINLKGTTVVGFGNAIFDQYIPFYFYESKTNNDKQGVILFYPEFENVNIMLLCRT